MDPDEQLPEIHLSADNPRVVAPDGAIYEASFYEVELTPEELAAEDAEAERQNQLWQRTSADLADAGLGDVVELVGCHFDDGRLTRVTLTLLTGATMPAPETLESVLHNIPYRFR